MNTESDTDLENPLDDFAGCHDGIIENFDRLRELAGLVDKDSQDPQIREIAHRLVKFFDEVVYTHHAEEEQELFTAVMDAAENEEQASEARGHIERLVAEHRDLESRWKHIESDVWRLARGKKASLDTELANQLAQRYLAHAEFEEQVFLPLSAKMLSKKGLSALGRSLHTRHQEMGTPFFI